MLAPLPPPLTSLLRRSLWTVVCLVSFAVASGVSAETPRPRAPALKVSENGHFLTHGDGRPFFYLADTAWELLHRLNREDAEAYLQRRADQGFTVIQTVVLAELDGLNVPNAYGDLPLKDRDPLQPNERYFEHVDWVVNKAESLGLHVGLLPTWGDKWNKKWGVGPEIFTVTNAEAYAAWLGRRYADRAVIWITGGDRPIETEGHRTLIEAMARGLRQGDRGSRLMTFHPMGGTGSSQWFHDEPWLDFNLRQNGHGSSFNVNYFKTNEDYQRLPTKPVIDGEPIYEGHPIAFKAEEFGISVAADVRRPLYWNLFTGACGHTYGHHSVWQMYDVNREPVNRPIMTWRDALNAPGSDQMRHGRRLLESRPVLTRIPDNDVIVPSTVSTAVPGAGPYRFVATRDAAGSYAMVYAPVSRPFSVRLSKINGPRVKAWWFNPRNGEATAAGEFSNTGDQSFTPPDSGEVLDWILVLDDAAKGFPPPGSRATHP